MSSPITLAELLERLQQGGTLLLPNNRAARELRSAHAAEQRGRGLTALATASAVSWSQWTSGLYNELIVSGAETRMLLNAAQEHALWLEVIAADPPPDALNSPDAMAELAASAFQLAAAWNTTARLRGSASNDDTRLFARWAEEFQRRSAKLRYLAAAQLEAALTEHAARGTLAVADTLQMVGFQDLTPAQTGLLDALRASGTQTESLTPVADKPMMQPVAVVLESPRVELAFAARWLRQRLETAQASGVQARIAVLVPGLAEERAEFEAALRESLAPELQSITADLSSTPWEFSVGVPLQSLALVTDALDLARWCTGPLSQPRITALLLSPYLCDDREAPRRSTHCCGEKTERCVLS